MKTSSILRRLGFRWTLPVFMLALYVALTWRTFGQDPLFFGVARWSDGHTTNDPGCPSFAPPMKWLIATVLNLPPMILAACIESALEGLAGVEFICSFLYWPFLTACPFVPLLWHWVGRWLDGVVGLRCVKAAKPAKWPLVALSRVGLLVLILPVFATLIFLIYIAVDSRPSSQSLAVVLCQASAVWASLASWPSFGAILLLRQLRLWRKAAQPRSDSSA